MRRVGSLVVIAVIGAACVRTPPKIDGVPAAPPSVSTLWTPPPQIDRAAVRDTSHLGISNNTPKQFSLAEVVDLALRTSPATRVSYTQARAAADVYGSTSGRLFPTLTAGVTIEQTRALSQPGRPPLDRSAYGPTLSLSYTVLDFGGRSGSIDVARQTAIAADLTHNSTVENTILLVEGAAFTYLSTRSQLSAQQLALDLATKALDAANERHRVGLATIADVLQAQTARSQAQLQLQTLQGQLQVTRGSLAVAMGLPASTPFDMPEITAVDSVHFITQSVDTLIEVAVRNRPELATSRAQAVAANSQIRVARSGYLPALGFTALGQNSGSNAAAYSGNTYTLGFGVQMPVFSGFSNQYDVAAASEQYQSALARSEATKQDIIQQVFTAYYTLRTSTDLVRTSRDLLASAIQSETVARERYREGVGTIVDLLVAQSALANARAQEIGSRWQWRSSLAQLAHDVGVLDARGDTTFTTLTPAPDVKPQ